MTKKSDSKGRKPYQTPTLKVFGQAKDITRTTSLGSAGDGGAAPFSMKMCLSGPAEIEEHKFLLSDSLVQESFIDLISKTVKPGDVVLDLGTGNALHAMVAARAGASKVYAIEISGIITAAQQIVERNGLSEKITFIRGDAPEVSLPEKVDVIISNVGFFESARTLPRAIMKYLKNGGKVIPDQLQLSIAPVSSAQFFKENVSFWNTQKFGFDFSPLKKWATHHPMYLRLEKENFLSAIYDCSHISLREKNSVSGSWRHKFKSTASGAMHGIGGWYSFWSENKQYLSTAPPLKMEEQLWTHFIFPLEEAIELKVGQEVEIQLSMDFVKNFPVWRWIVCANGHTYSYDSFQTLDI